MVKTKKNIKGKNLVVQSLWVGNELSRMEYYSILSYLKLGYDFHLYTYEPVKNVPKGTTILDGNKIIPKNKIFKLKETFLPFADIFRYKMLYENGGYWTDLDMIAIKPFDFKQPFVFSSERTIQKGAYKNVNHPFLPNIGVLKAPPKSDFYLELYETCMAYEKKGINNDKLKYMKILRKMIDKYNYHKYVKSPKLFCHLDWWYAKDAFIVKDDPKFFKEKYGVKGKSANSMFSGTYSVHFWRDLVTKKYKLDLNGVYESDCLWEKMIKRIDNM